MSDVCGVALLRRLSLVSFRIFQKSLGRFFLSFFLSFVVVSGLTERLLLCFLLERARAETFSFLPWGNVEGFEKKKSFSLFCFVFFVCFCDYLYPRQPTKRRRIAPRREKKKERKEEEERKKIERMEERQRGMREERGKKKGGRKKRKEKERKEKREGRKGQNEKAL